MLRLVSWTLLIFTTNICALAGGGHQHNSIETAAVVPLSVDYGRGLSLKVAADGTLFAAWAHADHVYLQRSGNGGKTWSNPMVVNAEPLPIRAGGESRIGLALGTSGEVFICFVRKLPQKWTSNLMFTRSTDGGFSFEPVRQINDDKDVTSHAFPVMDVAADGTLVLVWIDGRDRLKARLAGLEMEGLSLYGVRSRDGGVSFEANQQLVTGTCQCCRLALTFSKTREPVVLWRHIYGDHIRDHGFGVWSEDGFDQQRFSYEQWQFMGCPHQGPAVISSKQGGYFVAWYSVLDQQPMLFFAEVDATGKQAHDPIHIGAGMHPAIIEHNERVYLIWLEAQAGGMGLFGKVLEQGQWSNKQLLAQGEQSFDHPHLLQHNNTIHWAWQIDHELRMSPWPNINQNEP